jgi:hypothetical protein
MKSWDKNPKPIHRIRVLRPTLILKRRQRDIFVAPIPKSEKAPSGATSSEYPKEMIMNLQIPQEPNDPSSLLNRPWVDRDSAEA